MTNEEMKNPWQEGHLLQKKLYLGGRGLLTYTWMITQKYHPTLLLSDDDMIYTYANM